MPETYKEGDILQNDAGQRIVLRNNQWVPYTAQSSFQAGAMQKRPGGPILSGPEQQHPIRAIPPAILRSFGIDPAVVESASSFPEALKSGFGGAANELGEQAFE